MERFTPLYAIAYAIVYAIAYAIVYVIAYAVVYAILNGMENLRFDKEGYFHVLVFYGFSIF